MNATQLTQQVSDSLEQNCYNHSSNCITTTVSTILIDTIFVKIAQAVETLKEM